MKGVCWLQQKTDIQKNPKSGSKSAKINRSISQGTVYIVLPFEKDNPASYLSALNARSGICIVLPQNAYLRNHGCAEASTKRKSFFSAAALSFFCFLAIIFITIGMLNLMISSFKLQAYTQGYRVLEQAAHKPGSEPALQDAVVNEYQHALTKEMIAAPDTAFVATAERPEGVKSMLEQIIVAAEKPGAAAETGTARKVNIYNGTAKKLDRVVVQVDILDKAGHLLRTEYHTARGIAPLGNKVVVLNQSAPGAEIRCYVQEVRSKSLRTSLRSL